MKSPWIEIELSEMVTISAVEVTPVRTNKRYFQKVQIRGGPTSLSLQQDYKKNTVITSQTFFAKAGLVQFTQVLSTAIEKY